MPPRFSLAYPLKTGEGRELSAASLPWVRGVAKLGVDGSLRVSNRQQWAHIVTAADSREVQLEPK